MAYFLKVSREMLERLYRFPEGQLSMPLCLPISGGPHRLVGYACDGREVMASVDGHQVSLAEVADATVWVALLVDTCLPCVELRKTLAVECTGLGGAELGSPTPWDLLKDLLVRTGRHH